MTPWRWKHRFPRQCHNYKCNNVEMEVAAHRWYTTFAIESGLSQTTIAGTLEKLGPFRVCNIVHPNIRAFRRWYRRRQAEEAEKTRQYQERQRQIEAEWSERRKQQAVEAGAGDFDLFLDKVP
jgi:hypothetical protein